MVFVGLGNKDFTLYATRYEFPCHSQGESAVETGSFYRTNWEKGKKVKRVTVTVTVRKKGHYQLRPFL